MPFFKSTDFSLYKQVQDFLSQITVSLNNDLEAILLSLALIIEHDLAYLDKYNYNKVYASSEDFAYELRELRTDDLQKKYTILTINYQSQTLGEIIYGKKELTIFDEILLKELEMALLIRIQKKIHNQEVENVHQLELIQSLLFDSNIDLEELQKKFVLHHWNFTKNPNVLVINVKLINQISQEDIIAKMNEFRNLCLFNLNRFYNQIVSTIMGHEIVFIIDNCPVKEGNIQNLKEVYDSVEKKTRGELDFIVGVGDSKQTLTEIFLSYKEALKAIQIGSLLSEKNNTVFYNQLGVYKLLSNLSNHKEAGELITTYLTPVVQYDEKHNLDLLETLIVMINNNWDPKLASGELFVHYNTVKYRLKKISTILHINLDESEKRFNITLALKLYQLMSKPGDL